MVHSKEVFWYLGRLAMNISGERGGGGRGVPFERMNQPQIIQGLEIQFRLQEQCAGSGAHGWLYIT